MSAPFPLKIVVIGPESTGKSSLCQRLAAHYHAIWCPEYARQYLEEKKLGAHYKQDDLLAIAKGQLMQEDAFLQRAQARKDRFFFIDTDMYVMKIWSEFSFQKCDHWIMEQIAERRYDYYLLCDIDLPWTADPLREYPDQSDRRLLFNHYKDLLLQQSTPFSVIQGRDTIRFENAIRELEKQFSFNTDGLENASDSP